MSIKAVLFDLDGTLLPMDQDVFVKAYFSGIAAKLAPFGYEPKALIDAIWAGTVKMIKNDGRITNEEAFWNCFISVYGEINMLGKARGSKMGNNLLVQEIDKAGGIDFSKPVLLGYSGISDALLKKYIEDSRHIWEGYLDEVRYTRR